MEYKVLVLDLDGTLTNSKKEIPPRNKELIIKAQEKGVIVVLASGRPMYGVAPLAESLQLHHFGGYILAFNGGKTIACQTKEVVQEQIIAPEILPSLYASAKAYGMELISYEDDFILTEDPDNVYVQKEAFLNKMPTKKVDNLVEYITFHVPKCLMVGDADRLAEIEPEMKEKYGERLTIFRSEPYFMEIMPLGIDKAQSLGKLLEHLNLTKDEMIAVGDGFNDLTMIQFAGLGVAMANAQQVVKDVAQYITLSNEEDGVAHVVEKFLL
jgi:Cof subfamily protein (haloacid dehalogenase superfamily)